ncbi:phosphogluconate dehydrogenase (NAD(+)-dependent, decarboxylating) [Loigolactobacillus zhaoyuanensis]|uniref:Phosphogluconate dehydrogenase (NAD(+)-dependent, decarboxylating) n=1 Tax=Loigolactobacillus zhaoyuanensis TaxID=2486017 RepID=A0ABW8UEA2_9LACO|nr:decarboxylating 6-phosphogluconate dehydrogenase [Loigolactobacillus zhaoyuanensis]
MELGMIGLGKMGLNLVTNLQTHDHQVVAYDLDENTRAQAAAVGAQPAASVAELIAQLPHPRIIWVMVPAGKITQSVITDLSQKLTAGDIVIDGGNSFYRDSIAHNELLVAQGIHFFDVGTSGGMAGALNDGNFMIGGDQALFTTIEPIFKSIAAPSGYLYTGAVGSGHYLKMIHNGIEYGMMQAIAEGFDVLDHSEFKYDHAAVADMWNHGSVIRSWLMELAAQAFTADPGLEHLQGKMYSSGEGKWTLEEAIRLQVPTPVIAASLMNRYRSLEDDTYTGKVVAALRNQFGGHAVDKK